MPSQAQSHRSRRAWGYLGVSSGLHGAGLLAVSVLMGLGWWRWYSVTPGGPLEAHLVFAEPVPEWEDSAEAPLEELSNPEWDLP
ncbi:MAG: hypothetical protein KDB61_11945, partial [Planctomycetes bacterium]|nr:hypothetical protein [Planctomycetota bacterium]